MVLQECWSCSCESTGENLKTGYLTPYLESFEPDFRNGVNFAAGGSSTLPRNVPFNLNVQVLQFIRFHNQSLESHSKGNMPTSWRWSSTLRFLSLLLTCFDIKKKKKKHCTGSKNVVRDKNFRKALYTIDIGQNDLWVAFGSLSYAQVIEQIPSFISEIKDAIQVYYIYACSLDNSIFD